MIIVFITLYPNKNTDKSKNTEILKKSYRCFSVTNGVTNTALLKRYHNNFLEFP